MKCIEIPPPADIQTCIQLPSSKSICNRALIINALAGSTCRPENLSDCDDTRVMIEALTHMPEMIDIMAAGTAMRFLTAYLSVTPGTHVLTGTERMRQRPIKILVDALRSLGAQIEYTENEGYPPLKITGKALERHSLCLPGNVSSQYISALLMIGPMLAHGLNLELEGEIISRPYINLTLKGFRPAGSTIKRIYAVGIPSIAMNAIGSVMTFAMNNILIAFSSTAVAVFGVYFKLQSFVFMPIFGINNGMVPIIGYNYGARQPKRITQTIKLAVCFAECIMLCGLILAEVFPHVLLGVFNASPTMLAMGILALRIIAIHFPMAGFNVISSSAFQALGRGTLALLVSVIRQLVVLVPAAWLLSHTGNVNAVWFAFPIAELVAVTLCAVFMRKCHRDILLPMEAGQKTAAAV